MSHYHAVVWIDHREARIFHFNEQDFDKETVHPHAPAKHLHHKATERGPGNAPEDQNYYHAVAQAVADAQEFLVVGPAKAKLQLIRHLHRHDAALEARLAGVETVDHPTDKQIVAYARQYFHAHDRMRPQAG